MVRELSSEKRERFLNAALKLFTEKGVQNTSTAEIAREAGTASGTLFLYFPTKQQLINELVLMISKQEADHINTLLDPSMSVRDTFFTIWDGSIRWLLENLDAYQYSQQVRDSGLISRSLPGIGKIFQLLLQCHPKRSYRRQHQTLSSRPDRRISLPGYCRSNESHPDAVRFREIE